MPDLNTFKSTVANEIVSRARFEVTMSRIGKLLPGQLSATIHAFSCDEAEIPGLNLLTKESRTFGPEFKTAYQRAYDPVQLSFIIKNDFAARYFFEEWVDQINDFTNNISDYYDNYVSDITITQYGNYAINEAGKRIEEAGITRGILGGLTSGVQGIAGALPGGVGSVVSNGITKLFGDSNYQTPVLYRAILKNAYPVRVDTMPLSWADTDSFHRQTVNFVYESIEFPKVSPQKGGSGTNYNHFNKQFLG
jgi:hypothetical protein